jgi:hypothetical protein
MSWPRAGALLLVLALVGGAGAAQAQVASKCSAKKLKAAGAYFEALAKCRAKAVAKAASTDPACSQKALERLTSAIAKAEGKGDCLVLDAEIPVTGALDDSASEVIQILAPTCCALGSLCGWLSEAACLAHSGIPGAPGTVCSGAGGCVEAPAAGPCCQDSFVLSPLFVCLANSDQPGCESTGGTYSASALCRPTQQCVTSP